MMLRPFLRAKIHRATVTGADLNYVGSVTIDAELMDAADLDHLEQVEVYNISSGSRLRTYALRGPRGRGGVRINGAAAHLVNPGDLVIIAAYALLDRSELAEHRARVVLVDGDNRVVEVRRPGLADSVEGDDLSDPMAG
jgi:aspartate 1-decarboxylase